VTLGLLKISRPRGFSKDGALGGSLVGITIRAAVGVEETDNPSGITIGAPVNVVETEGFTNRPGDSLDGGPTTLPPSFTIGPPYFAISDAATLLDGAKVARGDLGPPL
jgi:hypothetical protein